jgi:hypothetical protein
MDRRQTAGMGIITPMECQESALECAKLAKAAKTPKERNILYAMCRCWQALAVQAMRYEQKDDSED